MRKGKETGNYCFPNIMGTMMKGISQRTQIEAEMLSVTFILIGLIVMGLFVVFFSEFSLFLKIMTGVNSVAGFVFLSSRLVTSFQQYQNYLSAMGLIEEWNSPEMKGGQEKNA